MIQSIIGPTFLFRSLRLLLTGLCWLVGAGACAPATSPALTTPALSASLPAPAAAPSPSPSPRSAPSPSAPAPSPTPLICRKTSGSTESIAVVVDGLKDPLQARVHLPPCYDPAAKLRYPVLYLLHGQGFDSSQWERLGFLSATDQLAPTQAFITVLPNEDDTTLNPYESRFGPALASELVARIDASYATCPKRSCRAIGGLSRGASWAIYLGLQSWGKFGMIGAHSLPPFYGLERDLPALLQAIPPGQRPRIYLDIGYSDPYRAPAAALEDLLTRAKVPHEWYLNSGEHNEDYWRAHAAAYAAWYAAQLTPP